MVFFSRIEVCKVKRDRKNETNEQVRQLNSNDIGSDKMATSGIVSVQISKMKYFFCL